MNSTKQRSESTLIDPAYIGKFVRDLERHRKVLFSEITSLNPNFLSNPPNIAEQLCKIVSILESEGRLPKKGGASLLTGLLYGLSKGEVEFFSMNSHALIKGKPELRHKPQYIRNADIKKIAAQIADTAGVACRFSSILPDTDTDFCGDEYDDLWDKNCNSITEISGVPTTRLSKITSLSFQDAEKIISRHPSLSLLKQNILSFTKDLKKLIDFKASDNFVEKQINSYAATGLMLEQTSKYALLLDIQKKVYPFEQPFYNFFRIHPLGILFCGQENLGSAMSQNQHVQNNGIRKGFAEPT